MLVERTYLVTYTYQPDTSCTSLRCHTEKYTLNLPKYYGSDGMIAKRLLDEINRSYYNRYDIALVNFWLVEEKE